MKELNSKTLISFFYNYQYYQFVIALIIHSIQIMMYCMLFEDYLFFYF